MHFTEEDKIPTELRFMPIFEWLQQLFPDKLSSFQSFIRLILNEQDRLILSLPNSMIFGKQATTSPSELMANPTVVHWITFALWMLS
jgi:hypothetical protein